MTTIRNVRKQLITKQDLALGKGKVIQRRGDENKELDKLDLVMGVSTIADLVVGDYDGQQVSVSGKLYLWNASSEAVANGTSVIAIPDVAIGRWLLLDDSVQGLDTVSKLRATPGEFDGQQVSLSGRDGREQLMLDWDAASTATDNDSSIFEVDGVAVGRWINRTRYASMHRLASASEGGRLVALPAYTSTERRSAMIDWLERAKPKVQPPLSKNNTGDAFIVFVGDSHTAGQGATGAAEDIFAVPAMPSPLGVTDAFHKRDPAYGNFGDLIAKDLRDKNYIGLRNRAIGTTETTFYNVFSGTWEQGTDASANVFGNITWAATSVIGNSVIKRGAPDFPRNWFEITYRKYSLGARVKFEFREVTQGGTVHLTRLKYANWILPSNIPGCTRADSPADINRVDTYAATSSYNNSVRFKMPYVGNWECRVTIESAGNAGAGGTGLYIQAHKIETCQFLNAGRGNHTILDYLGEPVTVGAGGSGDMDHTDHLAEVLAYNPTLIILEPMIINDWFHGVNLQDTFSAFDEMLRRIKAANCDCIILGPAPVITDAFPFDWAENPDSASKPPLASNLKGKGTYLQYYQVIERVAGIHGIRFINSYWHYLYRFYKDDHQNWTLGELAGRIHVNDAGHDIYRDAFTRYSGMLDALID
jgi:hypothetical protein